MKENIMSKEPVEIKEYGIKVNQYLTYSQIQSIVDGLKKLDSWAERQQSIDMCMLYFATDLKKEEIEGMKKKETPWEMTGKPSLSNPCND